MWARTVEQAYFVPVCVHSHFFYARKEIGGVKFTQARGNAVPWLTEWFPT
jgi:hypothetical protein